MQRDVEWADAQRLEGWAAEVRVNLIRLAAVIAFYGHHLINEFVWTGPADRSPTYHAAVTLVVLIWALMVFGLYVLLRRRWVPPFLKYAVTAADLLLISAVLVLGGEPHSTLPALYFLVIVAAGLRLSLALVYAATLGAMACYAVYLGYVRWGLELSDSQRLARPQQIVFLLALGGAGLLVGQSVRQVRRILMRQVTVIDQREEASA